MLYVLAAKRNFGLSPALLWQKMLDFQPKRWGNCMKSLKDTAVRSPMHGKSTLKVEVREVSRHGVWIFFKGKEYFLDFEHYPWFQKAVRSEIKNVKLLYEKHLYWPDLDVDLELKSLQDPGNYPLIYRERPVRVPGCYVKEKKSKPYGKKK